jgi:hypothetical protein
VFTSIAGMEAQMGELNVRLTVISALIPKQLRWQAELLALGEADEFAEVRRSVFESVRHERKAVIDAIDEQRVETLKQIQRERIAALQGLEKIGIGIIRNAVNTVQPRVTHERNAMVGAIEAMRKASVKEILTAFATEREEIIKSINHQRLETLKYLRASGREAENDADRMAVALVDYTIRQVYKLIAVFFLSTIVTGVIFILVWKKAARSPS